MIFLNSASSAAALVFYLHGVCTHTDTEGKQRKTRVWNILKSSEKNTIFNEHPIFTCHLSENYLTMMIALVLALLDLNLLKLPVVLVQQQKLTIFVDGVFYALDISASEIEF